MMKNLLSKVGLWLLLAVTMLVIATGAAIAKSPHNAVYVVGDSLSDPGNLYALTQWYPPSPPYAERFSNGPVWTEYFATKMNVPVDSHAYGGAFSGVFLFNGIPVSNFNNVQYPFLFNPLPGAFDQVDELLDAFPEGLNPEALYVIWVGSNDFFLGLGLGTPEGMTAVLSQTVANVAESVCTLSAFGARHFLVGNMPDIGLSPFAIQQGEGVAQAMSFAIANYNAGLSQVLGNLAPLCGESIAIFDSFQMLNDVVAAPADYGLTNVTDACLTPTGMCSNPEGYLFWDGVHPSTATHEIFSEKIRNAFCGTSEAHPGLRGQPAGIPPAAWRGVCFGTK